MRAVFDHATNIAPDIWTFYFRPLQPIRYVPGQFIELHLSHASADARGAQRWFTLSSAPHEALLAITTKIGAKTSSFKRALQALRPDAEVNIAAPMGDFVLPKDARIPLVFVAIGIGITPMRSMIAWLVHAGEQRNIHLIHAAKNEDALVFHELFSSTALKFTPIIKAPASSWQGETGTLDAARVLQCTGTPDNKMFYLAGPEKQIEVLTHELTRYGVSPSAIVTDYFQGYDA